MARTVAAPTRAYRLDVSARVLAALIGVYAMAALCAILLATVLPMPPIGRAVAGTLFAILIIPFAAMACFWAKSAARAWGGVLMACALLGGAAYGAGWHP